MIKLPPHGRGQRIGLFGGSFNPAHKGHYAVAKFALRSLDLDWVWWLVSPQNPLKDSKDIGDYEDRLAYTRRVARHPNFIVTDLERQMGANYTADTITKLQSLNAKGAKFVWIMGADSLSSFNRWHHWEDIAERVPFVVLARPGYSIRALGSKAATRFRQDRVRQTSQRAVLTQSLPAWAFITMPLRRESSSAIRKRRKSNKAS